MTPEKMPRQIRCSDCEAVFDADTIDRSVPGCPACGSTKVPQDPANDFDLRINTHDLRCLTIWASNFAAKNGFSAEHVLRRVRRALPEPHRDLALTLENEVKGLADHLMTGTVRASAAGVELYRDGRRVFPAGPSDGDDRPADSTEKQGRADLHDSLRRLAQAVVDADADMKIAPGEYFKARSAAIDALRAALEKP